jgi:hypothetical protein
MSALSISLPLFPCSFISTPNFHHRINFFSHQINPYFICKTLTHDANPDPFFHQVAPKNTNLQL